MNLNIYTLLIPLVIFFSKPTLGQLLNEFEHPQTQSIIYASNNIFPIHQEQVQYESAASSSRCPVSKIEKVENPVIRFQYNVYPNPSKGEFCVHFTTSSPSLQIKLSTLEGNTISIKDSPKRVSYFHYPDLSGGTYVLTVSDDSRSVSKRIQIRR